MEPAIKDAFMRMHKRIEELGSKINTASVEIHPERSEKIGELLVSLLNAQKEFPNISKNSDGASIGGKKIKYASLTDMQEATYPALHRNNLLVSQQPFTNQNGYEYVYTLLFHAPSEQWMSTRLSLIYEANSNAGNTDQRRGSSMTYAKRYMYAAMLGLIVDEPDADEAKFTPQEPKDTGQSCPTCLTGKIIESPSKFDNGMWRRCNNSNCKSKK